MTFSLKHERMIVGAVLLLTLVGRCLRLDQPILENYVGRQVPTAMVAKNLTRGSGFLYPQLDTSPAPNFFLVEPPIFAQLTAWVHELTSLEIGASGRLISALATTLAAWGIYRLARQREGPIVAIIALAAFACFPITIRYGRACQPEMLMLGLMIAGMALVDKPRSRMGVALGAILLASGLAVKVTACYVLIPTGLVLVADRPRWRWFAPVVVIPTGLWYLHAWQLINVPGGSLASLDNGSIWLQSLIPVAVFKLATLSNFARYLFIRAFTPVGFVLAAWGLFRMDRLFVIWGLSAVAMLGGLAAKAHHEYYWVALAPVAAVGIGRAIAQVSRWRPVAGVASLLVLIVFGLAQSRSTWATPVEWAAWREARTAIARFVPRDEPLIAPEALLYLADRHGCRLEIGREAQERAAREWGQRIVATDPIALIDFYQDHGAVYFADLLDPSDLRRTELHNSIRKRFIIWYDESGVLIAQLERP